MKRSRAGVWIVCGVFALVAAVLFFVNRQRAPVTTPDKPMASFPLTGSEVVEDVVQIFPRAIEKLKSSREPKKVESILSVLRGKLAEESPQKASQAITNFLDTKQDAATSLGFSLNPNGTLKQAPTIRTYLLDQLTQIDPAAAAAYAEKILNSKDSSDEWALSMRAYALAHPNARKFLAGKFAEMVRHEPWQQNPSVGFLEAFDVVVHTGAAELVPVLTELLRNNQAVAHASYLTLDRLTIEKPTEVLGQLQRQPELMEGREQTRANYFARADVADAAQRQIVEAYLMKLSASELDAFAGLYPSGNFMVSHNLLTRTVTPDGAAIAARDRGSLQVVQEWLADPRFERLRTHLERIQARLQMFAGPVTPAQE